MAIPSNLSEKFYLSARALPTASMEGLNGSQMTDALQALVKHARSAGDDAALRIGTAKELTEATARHVLVEKVGSYPAHGN